MNDAPDIYDLEFKDIYEVVFDDVETAVVAEVVTPVAEEATLINEPVAAMAGSVSLGESMQEMPVPIAVDTGLLAVAEVVEIAPAPVANEAEVVVSQEMQDLVSKTIETILSTNDKAIIPFGQIAEAVGNRLSRSKKKELIEAIRVDGRTEHFRGGAYLVIERSDKVMEAYQAGEDPLIDKRRIAQLIEQVVPTLKPASGGHIEHSAIMGAIKALGDFLTAEEKNEFFVQFYELPNIRPFKDGSFFIDIPKPEVEVVKPTKPERGTLTEAGVRVLGIESQNGKPLSGRQVNKALNKINKSDEMKEVRDRAKRMANPRQHGKNYRKRSGKKSQGKAHGKKVSLDQLIARMHEQP